MTHSESFMSVYLLFQQAKKKKKEIFLRWNIQLKLVIEQNFTEIRIVTCFGSTKNRVSLMTAE